MIDPSAPATLYALTNGGVFKTMNGGSNWTESFVGRFVSALAIDPSASATLYAASGGIFKSTDGGVSWTSTSTGLISTVALAIDPSATETLYVGTLDGGVFKSTDAGSTWTAFNAGLRNPTVNALTIDASTPARIYAGTGAGVFDYETVTEPPALIPRQRVILTTPRRRRP